MVGGRLVTGRLGGEPERELGGQFAGQRVGDRAEGGTGPGRVAGRQFPQPVVPGDAPVGGVLGSQVPSTVPAPARSPVTIRDRASARRVSADCATSCGVPWSPATAAASTAVRCPGSSVLSVAR